ncbi:MAG: SPOR domain-containing protein [Bacteroidaceae bacterium]|nr:SPOR domain-containing protein [Bacteroidaceae bacterium]
MRKFILLLLIHLCVGVVCAQVRTDDGAPVTPGKVTVETDGGTQTTDVPAAPARTEPADRNQGEANPASGAADEPRAESSEENSAAEVRTTRRVRRTYKTDETRRVILRRTTRSGTGTSGARMQREGFRVQVFTGGNRRQDRERAEYLATKIHELFPELNGYTHFYSPRWTCRVGDFETYEQAARYVALIQRAKVSYEVRVVKCNVWLPMK